MDKVVVTYNEILLKLQEKDLYFKEGYLQKRSVDILKDYKLSQRYLEKILVSKYEQKKVVEILEAIIKQKFDLKSLVEDIKNPLLLAVTGVGNCGKSSFVNSILKKEIAQVNQRAETWLINIINYIENDCVSGDGIVYDGIVYYEGKAGQLKNADEIKSLILEEDVLFNKALEKIKKLRLAVAEEELSRREKREKAEEIQRKYSYKSSLYKIKQFYDIDLLKKFRLADTPGLGQSNKSKIKDVLEYYKIADGLVFVVDVDRIDQEATKKSIQRIRKHSSVETEILLIINKADDLKYYENIKQKAEHNYGELVDYILPYSAKKVMEGHMRNDEQMLIDYNYYDALKFLNKVYTSNKIVRVDKKNESINIILEDSRQELLDKKDYILAKSKEFEENTLELKRKYMTIINRTVTEINSNIKASNNIIDRLIAKKVKGNITGEGLKSQLGTLLDDLHKINQKEISKSNEVVKSEMRRAMNDSFISDYKWLKDERIISDGFFKSFEEKMLSLEVKTYKKSFMTKGTEKFGKGLVGIYGLFNKTTKKGNEWANKSTKDKELMIREEKLIVHRKLENIRKGISNDLRNESSHFKDIIIRKVSDDFYEKYIVKDNLSKIDVIIKSLAKNLALDMISLDVIELLKEENII